MPNVLTTSPADLQRLSIDLERAVVVVGLCAQWCGTCREFRETFDALAAEWPDPAFIWLDIEDDAEVAGDIEVESFPTLAVFRDGVPVHFGASVPHYGVVARLLGALLVKTDAVVVDDAVSELPAQLARFVTKARGLSQKAP